MAKATINHVPPVPVEPEIESVALILSAQEARDLSVVLGQMKYEQGRLTYTVFSALYDAGLEPDTIVDDSNGRYDKFLEEVN